ncbi:hypothetical protein FHS89_001287 [Rubricella aquisinus]|uniref:Uncharacterized protein n=1 Tax=Rubricella aquisinus TaxID=2028108 RepID=A0A840X3M7_9RHOB|nr:hypothetical protein [Rubricella aquisinus]MBB5515277.1 hypothetical protein [Rubricella aquisinus]
MEALSQFALPALSVLVLLAVSTLIGLGQVRKTISIFEANHDLKKDSAGWLRSVTGWLVIVIWLSFTWLIATVIGDWAVTGDLDAAVDRGTVRLWVLLELLSALSDS